LNIERRQLSQSSRNRKKPIEESWCTTSFRVEVVGRAPILARARTQ
jgi:hypothetical protein